MKLNLEDPFLFLKLIARLVFITRNAREVPAKYRAQVKVEARPHLRRASRCLCESRDALCACEFERHVAFLNGAVMHLLAVNAIYSRPYVTQMREQSAALAKVSAKGGKEAAKKRATPELDDLIRGCLKRGESTRYYTKEWAFAFNRKASTVRRHIKRIKAELASG